MINFSNEKWKARRFGCIQSYFGHHQSSFHLHADSIVDNCRPDLISYAVATSISVVMAAVVAVVGVVAVAVAVILTVPVAARDAVIGPALLL